MFLIPEWMTKQALCLNIQCSANPFCSVSALLELVELLTHLFPDDS